MEALLPTVARPPVKSVSIHTSRTMMFAELKLLLEAVPEDVPAARYAHAALEDNALHKKTRDSRRKSLKYLQTLYGLRPEYPLFRLLRLFWKAD